MLSLKRNGAPFLWNGCAVLAEFASAIIYSIAETVKANNLKPYDYFVYLLEEIPKHMDQEDRTFLEDLLPWSEKLPEGI